MISPKTLEDAVAASVRLETNREALYNRRAKTIAVSLSDSAAEQTWPLFVRATEIIDLFMSG